MQIDNSTLSKLEVSNNDRADKIINDGQMLGGEIEEVRGDFKLNHLPVNAQCITRNDWLVVQRL